MCGAIWRSATRMWLLNCTLTRWDSKWSVRQQAQQTISHQSARSGCCQQPDRADFLWKDILFIVVKDLLSRARSLFRTSLHKALEVERTVLTREMDVALTYAFIASEARILPHQPARVTATQIWVEGGTAQRCFAYIMRADTGPDLFKLMQEGLRVVPRFRISTGSVGRGGMEGSSNLPSSIIDNDPCSASLASCHIPGILEADIRIDIASAEAGPGTCPIPEAGVKLGLKLGIGTIAELRNRRLFEAGKTCFAIIQCTQDAEGQSQDDTIKVLLLSAI